MLAYGRRCLTNEKLALLRYLSSGTNLPNTAGDVEGLRSSQPFVKTQFEPGEWDPDRTNPLYRPKYRSSAKIISADDFANRPTVGLSEEFESLQDAMVTISWLDQKQHKLVYQLYLDLMVSAESSSGGRTSHEYVMRVIAQKFNITADRVAAIVQLQHNEQQMILENPDIELCTELADQMDREFKAEIDEAYATFNLTKPDSFVEDPAGTLDLQPSKKWVIADDVFDIDQMSEDAIVRDERDARLIIDGHVYIEDVDKESIPVPLDKDCRSLLKQRGTIEKKMSEEHARVLSERKKKTAIEPAWRTTNGEGETRERYKFIAQTVNTRQLKKARMKHRSYINNNVANTLVEHNGELRAGNMADMDLISWKAIRNDHEHTYAGAKQGWLDRMNRNATKSWGKAPPRIPRLQQPIPLPPTEPQAGAIGSLDEIVENLSDATAADAIAATNVVDSKENDIDSQGSADQTPPLSSEMSPVDLNQDSVDQMSTTTTFSGDMESSDVKPVEDIVATNAINNTKENDIYSQGSADQTPPLSSEISPVDLIQDCVDQMSTTTTFSGVAESSDVKAVDDIAATNNINDTNNSGVDSHGSDGQTPTLSSEMSSVDLNQDSVDQMSTTTTFSGDMESSDVKPVEDIVATNAINNTKENDIYSQGSADQTPPLSSEMSPVDLNQISVDQMSTTTTFADFTESSDVKAVDDIAATNNINDTNNSGVDSHGSDGQTPTLSSEMSPVDLNQDSVDQMSTTTTFGDLTESSGVKAVDDIAATNIISDTTNSGVDSHGSDGQTPTLSSEMSPVDLNQDSVDQMSTTTTFGDFTESSDVKAVDDIAATNNINDTNNSDVDSHGSDGQTPTLSIEMSPVDLNQDSAGQMSTTTTFGDFMKSSYVKAVNNIAATNNISDAKDSGGDSQGLDSQSNSSDESSVDHGVDSTDQPSPTTATNDFEKDSDGTDEETKDALLADKNSDDGGKTPV